MNLEVKNLVKNYKNVRALKGVSINFTPGIYGLLGSNGAGKSTLIKIIVDGLTLTQGEIFCDGMNIKKMGQDYRKRIGYLPQNVGYYENFTGYEFLQYICSLKGMKDKKKIKNEVEQMLKCVNLTDVAKKKIGSYSGGMKQRLGIAQAFLGKPELIILDEPTQGLDPKERLKFKNLMVERAKDSIILLATHIVSDVEEIANSILILRDGEMIRNYTLNEAVSELDNKVWEVLSTCLLNRSDIRVVKSIIKDGREYHRIISEVKPCQNAVSHNPELDDVYFYYFGDDENVGNDKV